MAHWDGRRLMEEAGESMVEWLDNLDAHYDELRQNTRADIAELRQEMHAEFGKVRLEIAGVREEMRVGFASVRQDVATQMTTLLKWIVGLWITSLAATVGLITLMRGVH